MIKKIIKILKKHLDDAYNLEKMIGEDNCEMLWYYSPYVVLLHKPDKIQLYALAWELLGAIKGTDVRRLVEIPCQKETEKWISEHIPIGENDEEYISRLAKELRLWLLGYNSQVNLDGNDVVTTIVPND